MEFCGLSLEASVCVSVHEKPDYLPIAEPPKMKELMKLLFKEVPDKWDEIGTFLEIRASQLASIRQENLNNPQKCLLAMLNKWLDRQSPPPSWEAIAEAMELLGREDIAEKMATSPR